jgi:ATP-dependent DNA helicase RecG
LSELFTPELQQELKRLEKALQAEVQQGYINLQGRQYRFAEFLTLSLGQTPPAPLATDQKRTWMNLAQKFSRYEVLELPGRRSLIAETRRFLYQLHRQGEARPTEVKEAKAPYQENPPSSAERPTQSLAHSIAQLKGIGPKGAQALAKLGILYIEDLLRYYPRDYADYSNQKLIKQIQPGETVTLVGKIRQVSCFTSPKNHKLCILSLVVGDSSGRIKVSQFFAGPRFANRGWQELQKKNYPLNSTVAVSGLVKKSTGGLSLDKPEIEVLDEEGGLFKGKIIPIYALTEGVPASLIRRAVQRALPYAEVLGEPLPLSLRQDLSFLDLPQAIGKVHFPETIEDHKKARQRLVFDEFFFLQLGLLRRRWQQKEQEPGISFQTEGKLIHDFYKLLPFSLTGAQERVVKQILADLAAPQPMNRLVQGDVGSGKTVVAIISILAVLESGYQAAFMAPTEVLAEQHYRKLVQWFNQLHIPVELLTGSVRTAKRREILRQLATGELKILVGTHALIQEAVQFQNLGLAVIDEQHRFGVQQRAILQNKGRNPDVLTMTATPIPRTLALTLHGDLDVSQIDELPPGRKPIHTSVVRPSDRNQVHELMRRQLAEGNQIYVVLPLIEESEKLDLKSATEEYEHLSQVFAEFQVGLLHGRMKSEEKDAVITQFRDNQLHILVSTTVIEVGVDVPNASVMVIEHAERFGLAQMHQLRGRVGRGAAQSFCVLITHSQGDYALQRLNVLAQSNDGFVIAEMDLRLRGPGEVLGSRQSGLPDLALASLVDDQSTLELARVKAQEIVAEDPALRSYPLLKIELKKRLARLMQGSIMT